MNRRIDAKYWMRWTVGFAAYVGVLVLIAEVTHA